LALRASSARGGRFFADSEVTLCADAERRKNGLRPGFQTPFETGYIDSRWRRDTVKFSLP
jgi:hypothetical protein